MKAWEKLQWQAERKKQSICSSSGKKSLMSSAASVSFGPSNSMGRTLSMDSELPYESYGSNAGFADNRYGKPEPANNGSAFEQVQRQLVDSLTDWLERVQLQFEKNGGSLRQGPIDFDLGDVKKAQKLRRAKASLKAGTPALETRFHEDFGGATPSNPIQDMLMKVGQAHERELEELRLENEWLVQEVMSQQAGGLGRSEGNSEKNAGMMQAPSYGASDKMADALTEACDLFLKEEDTPQKSAMDSDDVAAEFWERSVAKTMSPFKDFVIQDEDRVRLSARFHAGLRNSLSPGSDSESTTQRKIDFGANGTASVSSMTSDGTSLGADRRSRDFLGNLCAGMSIEDRMAMEEVVKKKAGTLCTLFNSDPMMMAGSCFRMWANLAKQMRRHLHFPLRRTWTNCSHAPGEAKLSTSVNNIRVSTEAGFFGKMSVAPLFGGSEFTCEEEENTLTSRFSVVIVHPGSIKRLVWDLLGTFLLFTDLVLIPMQAFSPDWGLFTVGIDWVTLVFWTLDMAASCFTGFLDKGTTVMEPFAIFVNYLKTWFLLDVIVVVPDWIFLFMDMATANAEKTANGGSEAGTSKLLRGLRIVRIVRLLRLVKLKRIFAMVRDRIDSEIVFIVAGIFRLILMLLAVNHFLAAVWYSLGEAGQGLGMPNWIDSDQHFGDAVLGYKYVTALHWSLTQFTPASMSVQPQNTAERSFAITVLVFGLVLFSSFISNITTSMTQLRSMQDDKTKQFWLLRRYLRQHGIQTSLSFRILRYLEYACREQRDLVAESRVWVLNLLSDQLRNELQYVVLFWCMKSHPLFERTSSLSSVTMHRLGSSALLQLSLAASDLLFNGGSVATHMFIIVSGDIEYLKAEQDESEILIKDDWLCEATLWTQWVHLGAAKATTECKLVSIDEKEFAEVITLDVAVLELFSTYAQNYTNWLGSEERGHLSDAAHCDDATREKCWSFMYEPEEATPPQRQSVFTRVSVATASITFSAKTSARTSEISRDRSGTGSSGSRGSEGTSGAARTSQDSMASMGRPMG